MNCKEFAMMASDLAGEKLIEASKYKLALEELADMVVSRKA